MASGGGQDQEVKTVFGVVDEASRKTEKIANAYNEVAKAAEKAEKKTKSVKPSMSDAAAISAGVDPGEARQFRTEQRGERLRKQQAREAAEKGSIGARIAFGSAQLMGLSMQGTAGNLMQFGGTLGQVGIELSQFKGRTGAFGTAMAKASGVMTAAAVGFSIGTKIDEWTGLSDRLSGVRAALEETRRANLAVSKSQGYRSVAEFQAGKAALAKVAFDNKLNANLQKYSSQLAVLPTNATGKQLSEFNSSLKTVSQQMARDLGIPASQFGTVVTALTEAAKSTMATQFADYEKQSSASALLNEQVTMVAQYLDTLPANSPVEDQIKYAKMLGAAGQQILNDARFAGVSLESVVKMLDEKVTAGVASVAANLKERTEREIGITKDVQESMKRYKALSSRAGEDALKKRNAALLAEAERIRQKRGAGADQLESIYGELKKAGEEKSKRVFDFRGSRFDIKQEFAEGFDPDRIAVAFSNDIASLGERARQSGLSPIFGVR